tara:strand:- start:688 stop:1008 length:321 start_codon:yes stop_codon:yes gene_type:complete
MPLLTTFLAVGRVIFFRGLAALYSFKNALSLLVKAALKLMRDDAEADALPFLFVALPLIRSFLGAGVFAAPLRPALFFAMSLKKETPSFEEASDLMFQEITSYATP